MLPITKETVLEALDTDTPKSFNSLIYHFVLDEERQYNRLEKTLQKLHSQRKIEVVKKPISHIDVMCSQEHQRNGSMLRYYEFVRNKELGNGSAAGPSK